MIATGIKARARASGGIELESGEMKKGFFTITKSFRFQKGVRIENRDYDF